MTVRKLLGSEKLIVVRRMAWYRCDYMEHTRGKKHIDAGNARHLAVRAGVDPRTIYKLVRGEDVKGMAGNRAREVLIEAGYLTKREK